MYHRLTHVDGVALPAPVRLAGQPYRVADGGLLLEPPRPEERAYSTDGYAVLRLFGGRTPDDPVDFIGASLEPYRWPARDRLDVSRGGGDRGASFDGTRAGAGLTLVARDPRFLAAGTTLTFVAAPELPVPPEWALVLYFGPPMVQRRATGDLAAAELPEPEVERLEAELRAFIADRDRVNRDEAAVRLARAWRAPA